MTTKVRMAEWSKAPDSSSGSRERAWVQIPLLTYYCLFFIEESKHTPLGKKKLFSIVNSQNSFDVLNIFYKKKSSKTIKNTLNGSSHRLIRLFYVLYIHAKKKKTET
jgi:hypothetical protein